MLGYLERELGSKFVTPAVTGRTIIENVSRRAVLKGIGTIAGFAVALRILPSLAETFATYPTGGLDMPNGIKADPLAFVAIAADGTVTIVAHRSEMGTGSRTSLPMVVAEELDADWARVKIVQAPGDEMKYGNQDTDGSRSMRHHIQSMRQIGAAVRQMLEQAAAAKWGVDVKLVRAKNHEVVKGETGDKLGYGELAEAAMALPVPALETLSFKDEKDFRYLGKGEIGIYDLRDITTGKAVYGGDIKLPGMKFAVVARPGVVGGKVKSYDASATLKVPGVEKVVEIPASMMPAGFAPLGGIAVVANNTWTALQGRDQLKIEWDDGPHAVYNTESYRKEMTETVRKPGKVVRKRGDPDAALASAAKVVSAEYYQPHIAHAQMEPLVAVADVKDGKAEIWAPVQSPFGARTDIAKALGIDIANVTLNVTLLGGGFGRKSKGDYATEAALVSKAAGAPVKLQWTREDDIQADFYHTTSVQKIDAGIDASGKVIAWRHRDVSPTLFANFMPDPGEMHPRELGMGLIDTPFDVPNLAIENGKVMAHTRVGWFRAVNNIHHAFAIQSFVAELAHELGRDQKDMLLELIGPARRIDLKAEGIPEDFWNYGEPYAEYPIDTGRLRNVIELAAEQAGWGKELPKGEALGIAGHRSFVTYVASVVRVKIGDDGSIDIPEVYTAIDCGFCANPERVRSQTEGAAVMGTTLALYSKITHADGKVEQSNFHDYEMARMTRFPRIVHTYIVPHPFSVHASGIGEPVLPPFAPALANAIFNATGKRIRELPIGEKLA
jgi:isoquinoline 1-oxidoreductase beta subunit